MNTPLAAAVFHGAPWPPLPTVGPRSVDAQFSTRRYRKGEVPIPSHPSGIGPSPKDTP